MPKMTIISREKTYICLLHSFFIIHTAISRKLFGKSARDNPERYCGWFWVHSSSKKLKEWHDHERPWTYVSELLKESNKRKFDSCSVRNGVLIISHVTFRDYRVHIFSDNLSRNSCILVLNPFAEGQKLKKEMKNKPIHSGKDIQESWTFESHNPNEA